MKKEENTFSPKKHEELAQDSLFFLLFHVPDFLSLWFFSVNDSLPLSESFWKKDRRSDGLTHEETKKEKTISQKQ